MWLTEVAGRDASDDIGGDRNVKYNETSCEAYASRAYTFSMQYTIARGTLRKICSNL